MFEREIRDLDFVPRWAIVRTVRPQSVATHSFFVTAYVNDLCLELDVPMKTHLAAMQYAVCHDWDEVLTGDIPGPHKHKLLSLITLKNAWKKQITEWTNKVFPGLALRSGMDGLSEHDQEVVKAIVKVADNLDAACHMGDECQIGNSSCQEWFVRMSIQCVDSMVELGELLGLPEQTLDDTIEKIWTAVNSARDGRSRSPGLPFEDDEKKEEE